MIKILLCITLNKGTNMFIYYNNKLINKYKHINHLKSQLSSSNFLFIIYFSSSLEMPFSNVSDSSSIVHNILVLVSILQSKSFVFILIFHLLMPAFDFLLYLVVGLRMQHPFTCQIVVLLEYSHFIYVLSYPFLIISLFIMF